MQKIHYNKFTNLILANIKSISSDIATEYVKLACIDFCTHSQVLNKFIKDDVLCGLAEYPLLIDYPNEIIVYISNLMINGIEVDIIADGTNDYSDNKYMCCYVKDNNTIIIKPTPAQSSKNGLTYTICVAPTINSCCIDYIIYNRYYEIITAGALSKLYLMKDTKWYDPKLAMYNKDIFQRGINHAAINKKLGFARKHLKISQINL